jgi:hypothetical protein
VVVPRTPVALALTLLFALALCAPAPAATKGPTVRAELARLEASGAIDAAHAASYRR